MKLKNKILFYFNNLNEEELNKFKKFIEMDKRVIYTIDQIGVGDFDIEMMFRSTKEYFDFIRLLRSKFPIIREYETLSGIEMIKTDFIPW